MNTVYDYGPKVTILTKLTTTAASTTDSYKTHFLQNNIQTSYQDSLCSSMILTQEHITLRHMSTPNPERRVFGFGVWCQRTFLNTKKNLLRVEKIFLHKEKRKTQKLNSTSKVKSQKQNLDKKLKNVIWYEWTLRIWGSCRSEQYKSLSEVVGYVNSNSHNLSSMNS